MNNAATATTTVYAADLSNVTNEFVPVVSITDKDGDAHVFVNATTGLHDGKVWVVQTVSQSAPSGPLSAARHENRTTGIDLADVTGVYSENWTREEAGTFAEGYEFSPFNTDLVLNLEEAGFINIEWTEDGHLPL